LKEEANYMQHGPILWARGPHGMTILKLYFLKKLRVN